MAANTRPGDSMRGHPLISLAVFRRMVQTITPEQLRRIPVESLPEEIPLDLIEGAPPTLRELLEELSFTVGSRQLSQWGSDSEHFGQDVAAALEEADRPRSHYETNRLYDTVQTLHEEWLRQRRDDSDGQGSRACVERMEQAMPRLDAVRQEHGALLRTFQRIEDAIGNAGDSVPARLTAALGRLEPDIERTEAALSAWYEVNLEIVRGEMRAKRNEIEANAVEDAQLQERIDTLHQRLEDSQTALRRKLRPNVARRERDRLQERIQELVQERTENEWVIAESDMTRWLDAVVDVSLYMRGPNMEQVLRDGRLQLFFLLNQFCIQQEAAATQVARNPFLQLNPQQTIEFLLVSERFIVQYFSKKRNDLTRWVGGEAQRKLAQLDTVQENILGEYRRHRKYE